MCRLFSVFAYLSEISRNNEVICLPLKQKIFKKINKIVVSGVFMGYKRVNLKNFFVRYINAKVESPDKFAPK